MTDYYNILGLEKNASAEDIKKAYRKLSLKFHPDRNGGDPFFENMFKQINEAYTVLGDPAKRSAYDSSRSSQGRPSQPGSGQYTHGHSAGPVIEVFRADKVYFKNGEIIYFDWKTSGATYVQIKPFGTVTASGTKAFRINNFNKERLTVTLVATNGANKTVTRTILLTNTSFSHYASHTQGSADGAYTAASGNRHAEGYFSLKGRLRRLDYFKRMCVLLFLGIIVATLTPDRAGMNFFDSLAVAGIVLLVLIQSKKRLHDINLSTTYCLLLFIPVINSIFLLYLLFAGGTQGSNEYGPDPRI